MPVELTIHAVHQGGMRFTAGNGTHEVQVDYPLQPGDRSLGDDGVLIKSHLACEVGRTGPAEKQMVSLGHHLLGDQNRVLDTPDCCHSSETAVLQHQRRVHLDKSVDRQVRPGPGVKQRIVFHDPYGSHDRLHRAPALPQQTVSFLQRLGQPGCVRRLVVNRAGSAVADDAQRIVDHLRLRSAVPVARRPMSISGRPGRNGRSCRQPSEAEPLPRTLAAGTSLPRGRIRPASSGKTRPRLRAVGTDHHAGSSRTI